MTKAEFEFYPPTALPDGWKWMPLEDLMDQPKQDIVDGPFGSNLKASEYMEEGIPIARLQNVDRNIFIHKNIKFVTREKAEELSRHTFKPGDILITKLGDPLGEACIAPSTIEYGVIVADLVRVRPAENKVDRRYLTYAINSPLVARQFEKHTKGTTRPRVNLGMIRKLPIPVAPRERQGGVVAEIEKQFSRLDEAVTNLKRAKANLKRYKAAVLKAAVEGKLTEAWRQQHPGTEPASELLQRILAERRAKWEQTELAKMQGKGKSPKDDTWKKKHPEPATPDTTGLPELPAGWVWASLGECFKVAVGATPSRKEHQYWNGNVSWVSSGEVQFCRIRETKEKISEAGLLNSSTQINPPGTVLLGMIGEGKTRGQAAILEIPAANNQNCAAIWVAHAGLPSSYVYHWFAAQYEETRLVGSGNNQQALNKSLVEAMVFPLPPLAEQQAIIEEIERRLSLTDEGESQVNTNLQRAERLRQSILVTAFTPPVKEFAKPTLYANREQRVAS